MQKKIFRTYLDDLGEERLCVAIPRPGDVVVADDLVREALLHPRNAHLSYQAGNCDLLRKLLQLLITLLRQIAQNRR